MIIKPYCLSNIKLEFSNKKTHTIPCPLSKVELEKYHMMCFYLDSNDNGDINHAEVPLNFVINPLKTSVEERFIGVWRSWLADGTPTLGFYLRYDGKNFIVVRNFPTASQMLYIYRIMLY